MAPIAELLERLAYEFALVRPLIPTYLHVLLSAVFSIYIGVHASLSIPSTAEKPIKATKQAKEEDEEISEDEKEEASQKKMEGFSPMDAILFPLLAGFTLAGLYFLIKWLEDPAFLNRLLNWYFSVFGLLSVSRLITDSTAVVTSYVFPAIYTSGGEAWRIDRKRRQAESHSNPTTKRDTPLPGVFSKLRLSPRVNKTLWTLRELPARQLHMRTYIHKVAEGHFRMGPQEFLGLILAIMAVLYFNLIDKPWWLTNVLGVSLSYGALQLMSPTTFWTGTLILSSLFVYDIYFVFFTPLMVTVAKELDIPIKLLFPRPQTPNEESSKRSLAMLGLGDIVLPGMMIGLALRFDLYLFYLRKQTRRASTKRGSTKNQDQPTEIFKAKYQPATGGWGERFWASGGASGTVIKGQGGCFPKTYFHASIVGYVLGMVTTLGILEVFGHAQPALLYLVPGVLGTLWGTAFLKGDTTLMWEYNEAAEDGLKDKKIENYRGMPRNLSHSQREQFAKMWKEMAKEKAKKEIAILDAGMSQGQNDLENHTKIGKASSKSKKELVSFSISLPDRLRQHQSLSEEVSMKKKVGATRPSLEDELHIASQDDLGSQDALNTTGLRWRSAADDLEKPNGKRQKRE